jgi:hypothetical protein
MISIMDYENASLHLMNGNGTGTKGVNYNNLKDVACLSAQNQEACGWSTLRADCIVAGSTAGTPLTERSVLCHTIS